jgi:hypothetical protein
MEQKRNQNIQKETESAEALKASPTGGGLEGACIIRQATKQDCPRMMELIKELAIYEKAPDAVTVDFNHFVESGFGDKPIWWAFLAEVNGRVEGFALWYIRYST